MKKITEEMAQTAMQMHSQGRSVSSIAKQFEVSYYSMYMCLMGGGWVKKEAWPDDRSKNLIRIANLYGGVSKAAKITGIPRWQFYYAKKKLNNV
jgi:hypothetical protein